MTEQRRARPIFPAITWRPQTQVHCGSPACSGFADVVLVSLVRYAARAKLLTLYAKWFATVLLVVAPAECKLCGYMISNVSCSERPKIKR